MPALEDHIALSLKATREAIAQIPVISDRELVQSALERYLDEAIFPVLRSDVTDLLELNTILEETLAKSYEARLVLLSRLLRFFKDDPGSLLITASLVKDLRLEESLDNDAASCFRSAVRMYQRMLRVYLTRIVPVLVEEDVPFNHEWLQQLHWVTGLLDLSLTAVGAFMEESGLSDLAGTAESLCALAKEYSLDYAAHINTNPWVRPGKRSPSVETPTAQDGWNDVRISRAMMKRMSR